MKPSHVTVAERHQFLEQDGHAQNVTIMISAQSVIMATSMFCSIGFTVLICLNEQSEIIY